MSAELTHDDLMRLDSILNLTSELSIASGRLGAAIDAISDLDRQRLEPYREDVERILTGLQEAISFFKVQQATDSDTPAASRPNASALPAKPALAFGLQPPLPVGDAGEYRRF